MSTPMTENKEFSFRLKEARKTRGLNQTELAKKVKMDPSAIGHFEGNRRKPSFANVRVLAKALNVSSDYLLGRSESLEGATTAFRGEEHLSDADREWIQMLIDTKVSDKKTSE